MRERIRQESGVALVTALVAVVLISTITALVLTLSLRQETQSSNQRREDIVIAGTEALLDRYASKLTLDPFFYLHWVDEAERARVCDDSSSASYKSVVEPGNAWDDGCKIWTYQNPDRDGDSSPDPDPDWWVHPLLEGTFVDTSAVDRDDVSVQLEVAPPTPTTPLTVLVAGKSGERVNRRVIEAAITATSLSEFFRATEASLGYGKNAEIWGKIYTGGNLSFGCCPNGVVHADVYSEGSITNDPIYADGSKGWDSDGGVHGDIRDVFPEPLDFDSFWDDLDDIKSAACGGGGVCLTEGGIKAWLVHPYVSAGTGKLAVWKSNDNRTISCVNAEEYWWLYSHDPYGADTFSDMWDFHGTLDMPANGTLWANGHLVVGHHGWSSGTDIDGDGYVDGVVKGSLSMYAGTSATPRNVIINADIFYDGQNPVTLDVSTSDTFALIASDEVVINPNATHADAVFNVNASLLAQGGAWRLAYTCGLSGSRVTPSGSTLNIKGSIASKKTGGNPSGSYSKRNYYFDQRLQYLRPPLYPILGTDWRYEDWKELPLPGWASG
ncbi:MAG: pilus assembly PilX N-terminal domain-containing protein [Acidimicrobiia bacterium]